MRFIRLTLLVLVTVSLLAPAVEASAPQRTRRRLAPKSLFYRSPPPSYEQTRRALNDYYPKYYGGFHARDLQSIGIPGGDIGPRGNGVWMTPW